MSEVQQYCTSCGTGLKPGARFCANCGRAVVAKATPASPPQFSSDGKQWWDGTKWNLVASAPSVAIPPATPVITTRMDSNLSGSPATKKSRHLPRSLAIGLGVALLVLVGILWATGEFSPASNTINPPTSKADSGLGAGPIYWHFNCNQDANCMTYGHNELTAPGSNTGIFQDWPDLASCKQELAAYPTLFPKQWCSTSKNPADTGP
jgi:hypothetical protein